MTEPSNIISLADAKAERMPHVQGEAFYMRCDHKWRGVWPTGQTELECPGCHCMTGRGVFDVAPHKGALLFTCNCGNQLYNLLKDRVHCPNCGQQTSYSDL